MVDLFIFLNRAIEGSPGIALSAAFLWGVLSIILSPCHLASIPLIIGFINGQGPTTPRRALALSALFAIGIMLTIALLGLITAATGSMLGDAGPYGNYFVALIFFLVGLNLFGILPMPWSGPETVAMKRKGLLAAFLLGLIFGIALGPCTFAFMAPVLGATFSMAHTQPALSIALLLAYAVGHCAIIVFAGTFVESIQRYLNWSETSRGPIILKKICAVLVFVGGFYMIYTAL